MKRIVANQEFQLSGRTIAAGTELARYETAEGVSFDFVIGALTRGMVDVVTDAGDEANKADDSEDDDEIDPSFAGLTEADARALNFANRAELEAFVAAGNSLHEAGLSKAAEKRVLAWLKTSGQQ